MSNPELKFQTPFKGESSAAQSIINSHDCVHKLIAARPAQLDQSGNPITPPLARNYGVVSPDTPNNSPPVQNQDNAPNARVRPRKPRAFTVRRLVKNAANLALAYSILSGAATEVIDEQLHTDEVELAQSLAATLPSKNELAPISSEPIVNPSPSESFKSLREQRLDTQNNKQFIGSYRSTKGMDFNFYSIGVGDEQPSDFTINPETIELGLQHYFTSTENAPHNAARTAALANIERLMAGERIIVDVVIENGDQKSCVDYDSNITKGSISACSQTIASTSTMYDISDGAVILMSDGQPWGAPKWIESSVSHVTDTILPFNIAPPDLHTDKKLLNFYHEVGHVLAISEVDDAFITNTYTEGDDEHEYIESILNDESIFRGGYDFQGATGEHPHFSWTIRYMIENDLLPPLIETSNK